MFALRALQIDLIFKAAAAGSPILLPQSRQCAISSTVFEQ